MIFITGDCHQNYGRFNTECFPEQKEMTKDDYVIVCGDFGYWLPSKEQDWWLKWLDEKPFTTLFVDGNHEYYRTNRAWIAKHHYEHKYGLYDLPVEKWHGGSVHKINDSVIHMMRGQIFDINGRSFFTFGGARSHDISDGILDPDDYPLGGADPEFKTKHKRLRAMNAMYRIKGTSWWPEEMPDSAEMEEGRRNLEKHGNKVDFIITHDAPSTILALYGHGRLEIDELNRYLQEIDYSVGFKKWFFGHHHNNVNVTDKHLLIYEQIVQVQ